MSQRSSQTGSGTDATLAAQIIASKVSPQNATFHFCSKDVYTGMFVFSKEMQKFVRNGPGVYQTWDCETYEGTWENDLLQECKIMFIDGSVFTGTLTDMQIQGHGKYLFRNEVEIQGNFVNGILTTGAQLKDPNGNLWKGAVGNNGDAVTFRSMNVFWQSVLNIPSSDQMYYEDNEENENIWEMCY